MEITITEVDILVMANIFLSVITVIFASLCWIWLYRVIHFGRHRMKHIDRAFGCANAMIDVEIEKFKLGLRGKLSVQEGRDILARYRNCIWSYNKILKLKNLFVWDTSKMITDMESYIEMHTENPAIDKYIKEIN